MTHTITCPECSRQLRVPDDLLGCMVECPACSHNFDAPSGEPAEPLPQRASPPPRPDKDADRPSSRRRRRDEEDDDRDSKPRPRRFAQEDEDDEDRSIRRRDEKPGKVQAIAIMMLVGGILALIHGVIWAVSVVGLCWPGTYYSVLFGI